MNNKDNYKILLNSLISNLLFENNLNERLGTDTEGLNNTGVGPQSSSKMGIYDRPGPDPERDKKDLEDMDIAISAQNIVSVGSIVDNIPNEDAILDKNYIPQNYDEMGNVTSYLIKQLEDVNDIDKSWKIVTSALKKIKGEKWI